MLYVKQNELEKFWSQCACSAWDRHIKHFITFLHRFLVGILWGRMLKIIDWKNRGKYFCERNLSESARGKEICKNSRANSKAVIDACTFNRFNGITSDLSWCSINISALNHFVASLLLCKRIKFFAEFFRNEFYWLVSEEMTISMW